MKSNYFNLYYILNTLILLSYFFIRLFFKRKDIINQIDWVGTNKEQTIILILFVFLLNKFYKSICLQEFISNVFFYSKICIVFLMIIGVSSIDWITLFVCSCILLFVFIKEPLIYTKNTFYELKDMVIFKDLLNYKFKDLYDYSNLKNHNFFIKNKSLLNNKNNFLEFYNKKYTFVVFYVNFANNCNYLNTIWNEFSLLKCKKLNFIRINLEKNKKIAEEYKINLSAYSRQLPTTILFENEKEILRFPPINKEGRVAKILKYNKKAILDYFNLEMIFLSSYLE